MNKKFKLVALFLALSMALVACGGGNAPSGDATSETKNNGEVTTSTEDFKEVVDNEGDVIEGGTFRKAVVSDTAFPGVFNAALYEANPDWEIMGNTMYGGFSSGENFKLGEKGPLTAELDSEKKTVTVHINAKYTWNDGTPVTAEDYAYYYYFIADKDYPGVRYDQDFQDVVGIKDYHDGKTDTISGITMPDDKTVVIEYENFGPGKAWGEGVSYEAMNKKQMEEALKTTPMKDIKESDAVRKNPMSAGPFVISNVVPGESVEFVRNEHYWKGVPKLEKVIVEVISPSTALSALKAGKFDYMSLQSDMYLDAKELTNIDILANMDQYYAYLGFKLGSYDQEKGEIMTNPDAKMADVNLRRAMGYAYDMDSVNTNFFHGLSPRATSMIVPIFSFHNSELEGYKYDPEKAKAILDEAGYEDKDGDGFRETPNGDPLTINFLYMSGSETSEPLSQYFIQSWADIGLKVELVDGRLWDLNAFYDLVMKDDPKVDIYMGAWGTGSNPDPNGLYSKVAEYNFPRYTDEKIEDALARIQSPESLDENFQKTAYRDFEQQMFDMAPVIPLRYRYQLVAINKRVKHFDIRYITEFDYSMIELTQDNPVVGE